jgi:hypothetical protein
LRRLIGDPGNPDAYFQNFDEAIADKGFKKQYLLVEQ